MMIRLAALVMLVGGVLANAAWAEELKTVPENKIEMQLSFAPLVKRTANRGQCLCRQAGNAPDALFRSVLREFFGQQMPNRTEKQSSLGSGVIVDAKGLVITNNHVIADADNVGSHWPMAASSQRRSLSRMSGSIWRC
jgi:S1-C subfamily serine protease